MVLNTCTHNSYFIVYCDCVTTKYEIYIFYNRNIGIGLGSISARVGGMLSPYASVLVRLLTNGVNFTESFF